MLEKESIYQRGEELNSLEKTFLENYRQSDYDRPSLAVDMAVFTLISKGSADYRKLPEKEFSILLIKRGEHPFMDYWALPGGFVRKGERIEDTAYRELLEEAGVSNIYLSQLHCFSEPDRDPRGWIISNVFTALAEESSFDLKAGEDAVEAKWFDVSYNLIHTASDVSVGDKILIKQYQLNLSYEDIHLSATIEVRNHLNNKKKTMEYHVLASSGIAFDHSKIIGYAIQELRDNLNSSMLAFELLPECFTLTEIQRLYEIILGEKLLAANFRRKIADYVIETEEMTEGLGHRPSKLYRKNIR